MSEETGLSPMQNHAAPSPMVSIIIVNWNMSALTLECLRSVTKHTRSVPYEVIVVDNGSAPDEVEILQQGCAGNPVRFIALRHNRYFGEANNIGVEAAVGTYVLLVNNDVIVTPGYLEPLLAALQSGFRAGAVGPRFVYPDGRLQEAGAYVRPDGWTIQHGKTDSPNALIAGPGLHIVDYCSAACLLLRRDVFLSIGGFDPVFEPAYFEDADLCLRLHSMGLYTYYCGDATVVHHEGATTKSIWENEACRKTTAESHRKFVLRWGPYLKERMQAEVEPTPSGWIDWQPGTDCADPVTTVHIHGSGLVQDTPSWRTILRIAATLNGTFHIVLVADEVCSRTRIYSFCRHLGLEVRDFSLRRFCGDLLNNNMTRVTLLADEADPSNVSVSGPLQHEVNELMKHLAPFH